MIDIFILFHSISPRSCWYSSGWHQSFFQHFHCLDGANTYQRYVYYKHRFMHISSYETFSGSSNGKTVSFFIYFRHIWWDALLTCTHNPGTACRTVWCCLFTVLLCPSASSSFHTLGSFTIPVLAEKGYLVIMTPLRSMILEKILIEGLEEDNPLTPIKG